MKPMIAILLLAAVLVGPMGTETMGSGTVQQSGLSASLSPTQVNPRGQVTVTSIQPCPQAMQLVWSLGPGAISGSVATNADGGWTVRFTAPATPGVSPFFAHCAEEPGGNAVAMYRQLNFTVVSPARPRFTG
jgi:hypothetical protein